jgi:hypothetical protein
MPGGGPMPMGGPPIIPGGPSGRCPMPGMPTCAAGARQMELCTGRLVSRTANLVCYLLSLRARARTAMHCLRAWVIRDAMVLRTWPAHTRSHHARRWPHAHRRSHAHACTDRAGSQRRGDAAHTLETAGVQTRAARVRTAPATDWGTAR